MDLLTSLASVAGILACMGVSIQIMDMILNRRPTAYVKDGELYVYNPKTRPIFVDVKLEDVDLIKRNQHTGCVDGYEKGSRIIHGESPIAPMSNQKINLTCAFLTKKYKISVSRKLFSSRFTVTVLQR